jgi:hypothetical protein
MKFFTTCFDQYGHHRVFNIIVDESTVLLLSWLRYYCLMYSPLYAHVYL